MLSDRVSEAANSNKEAHEQAIFDSQFKTSSQAKCKWLELLRFELLKRKDSDEAIYEIFSETINQSSADAMVAWMAKTFRDPCYAPKLMKMIGDLTLSSVFQHIIYSHFTC